MCAARIIVVVANTWVVFLGVSRVLSAHLDIARIGPELLEALLYTTYQIEIQTRAGKERKMASVLDENCFSFLALLDDSHSIFHPSSLACAPGPCAKSAYCPVGKG